jgi:hypothetical protein
MAFEYEMTQDVRTYFAGEDLSAKQYYFVKRDSSGNIVAITGDTDLPWGVLLNKPSASGRMAQVCRKGIVKLSADAAILVGAVLGTSADGQATTRVVGTDTTKYVVGTAEEAASGAGSLIAAAINCIDPHTAD